jgi:DNA-binding beta-propeller fold protein YncE
MTIRIKLCVVALFALLGTMAFAAMNGPTGVAVDTKGNLYVANFNSNQILVYGPTHKLIKAKTITKDVSGPLAVATDAQNNVYVANFTTSTITEYNSSGVELNSFTSHISGPTGLSVDAFGDIWVINNASSLIALDPAGAILATIPASAVAGATTLYSVAVTTVFEIGSNAAMTVNYASDALVFLNPSALGVPGDHGKAVAVDASSAFYAADGNGTIWKNFSPLSFTLSYMPSGMAADSAHSLLYFSNNATNKVDVYTMAGTLVTTLQ